MTRRQIHAEKRQLAAEREAMARKKKNSQTTAGSGSTTQHNTDGKVKVQFTIDVSSDPNLSTPKPTSAAVVTETLREKEARRQEQAEKRRLAAMKAGQDSHETTVDDSKRHRFEAAGYNVNIPSSSNVKRDDTMETERCMDPYEKVEYEIAQLKNKMDMLERQKDTELSSLKEQMKSMEIQLALTEKALAGMDHATPANMAKFHGIYKKSIRFHGKNREIGGFATRQQASLAREIAYAFLYPSSDNIESKEADEIFEQAKVKAWEGVYTQFK